MMQSEIDVSVTEGSVFVQQCPCRGVTLPDGSAGVLWRGTAYPLLPGNRIDLAAPVVASRGPNHAVIAGDEATWILIEGLPAALAEARRALEQQGAVVSRSGRWLGDPVNGLAFDWFLRCDGRLEAAAVAAWLGAAVPSLAPPDPAARAQILEQRIADLLADLARLDAALQRALAAPAVAPLPAASATDAALTDLALLDAREQIAALQDKLTSTGPAAPPNIVTTRLREELESVVRAFRPDVVLLRDSWLVALGEFHSRGGLYRAINELPISGMRPDSWKKLRGAERWWESHVSTGRDNSGRAYARFDTAERRWKLLLGWKGEQDRDIAWLQQQA